MRKLKGFTLIELAVTVVIILIVTGVGIIAYVGYVEHAKTAEALVNLGAIRTAENVNKMTCGTYVPADNVEQINERLSLEIVPKYYEYRVAGVTDDNFLVIATRISQDVLADSLGMASVVISMDKNGAIANGFGDYTNLGGGGTGTGGTGGTGTGSGGEPSGTGGGSPGGYGSPGGGSGTSVGGAGTGGGGGGSAGGGGGTGVGSGVIYANVEPVAYSADISTALDMLSSVSGLNITYTSAEGQTITSDSVGYYLSLAQEENIPIEYNADMPDSILGGWSPDNQDIELNELMKTSPGFPTEAVASIILHELVHADYFYNSDKWEQRILTLWPSVAADITAHPDDPNYSLRNPNLIDVIWNPTTKTFEAVHPLVYTITAEYFAWFAEAQVWGQYKDKYAGIPGAGIQTENEGYDYCEQGEDDLRAYLRTFSSYATLPDMYYDPNNPGG